MMTLLNHVNDEELHAEIKDYIGRISPSQEKIVKALQGKIPYSKSLRLNQIKSAFGK